ERRAIRPAAGLVDRHDAGVLEPRGDQRLAEEPHLAGVAAPEHLLDRDLAGELLVVGARDGAEAAAAVLAEDVVALAIADLERRGQPARRRLREPVVLGRATRATRVTRVARAFAGRAGRTVRALLGTRRVLLLRYDGRLHGVRDDSRVRGDVASGGPGAEREDRGTVAPSHRGGAPCKARSRIVGLTSPRTGVAPAQHRYGRAFRSPSGAVSIRRTRARSLGSGGTPAVFRPDRSGAIAPRRLGAQPERTRATGSWVRSARSRRRRREVEIVCAERARTARPAGISVSPTPPHTSIAG